MYCKLSTSNKEKGIVLPGCLKGRSWNRRSRSRLLDVRLAAEVKKTVARSWPYNSLKSLNSAWKHISNSLVPYGWRLEVQDFYIEQEKDPSSRGIQARNSQIARRMLSTHQLLVVLWWYNDNKLRFIKGLSAQKWYSNKLCLLGRVPDARAGIFVQVLQEQTPFLYTPVESLVWTKTKVTTRSSEETRSQGNLVPLY